jgi:hypothetical protein
MEVMATMNRTQLWLPLLRALTTATPDWTVWKNAESALTGTGDVDSAAPRPAWPTVVRTVHGWALEQQLGPTIVCRHIPRTLNLLTVAPDGRSLLQLEVKAGATFRGSLQFSARDVLGLSSLDELGFRRLRAGAEGVLKLLNNGMVRGAQPNWEGIRAKNVLALLAADPEGVAAMAQRFGPARDALLRGVTAVQHDTWDRRAMGTVEAWALAKSLVQPQVLAERAWFRAYRKRTDPVLQVVYRADRMVQDDVGAWLRDVARTHRLLSAAAPSAS